ncbi:MAG TPA: hypothetical protein VEU47_18795 [Candidatus Cybelea sp.]|nr:hypothetical protein [Candidatus Cybelea sp.]
MSDAQQPQQHPIGEIVASHRLAADCVVLLGWGAEPLAHEGAAMLDDRRQDRGRYRAAGWRMDEDGTSRHWFVAALRAPGVGEAADGARLRLHGAGAVRPVLGCLPAFDPTAGAFAGELVRRLGPHSQAATRFLLESFGARASRGIPAVSALIGAVLLAGSEEDGVIEILGPIAGEGLFLQGWMRHPRVAGPRLLLQGERLEEHAAACATFSRADVEAPALGFVALVRPAEGNAPEAPRFVYFRAGNHLLRLGVLSGAMRLPADEAATHLRETLPHLRGDPAAERALLAAARPRFAGQDTVSGLSRPVRMAIDLAAHVKGAGWYVTGWLLDPMNQVAAVSIHGSDRSAERIDRRWTRVVRADVSAGFAADPLFQGRIGHDKHGFTVFVPHDGDDMRAWFELELGGGDLAFMPLAVTAMDGTDERRRLLESFDVHKSSAQEIVERQLGPLFAAAAEAPRERTGHSVLRAGNDTSDAVLIVPIVESSLRTNVIAAGLATCGPGDAASIVFVCSPSAAESARSLQRELDFYGLDASVLMADAPLDACDAFGVGVAATKADKLLLLSPCTRPVTQDWARKLLDALGDGSVPACASPTLLYEDWSVRYAGIDGVRFLDVPPFADATSARAGYPRGWSRAEAPKVTLAASLEACALTRSAFEKAQGFAGAFALTGNAGLDLFLRMRTAGVRMSWVGEVELYGLDDAVDAGEYWRRTGEMVDGWCLRARWQGRVPPAINVVPHASDAPIADVPPGEPSLRVAVSGSR